MNGKEVSTETRNETWRVPLCDIFEFEDRYEVMLDMPGVDEKDLDVTYQNGTLSITGCVEKCECSHVHVLKKEYTSANFKQEFTVSEQNVAIDKINAELKDGELKLTLPKSEQIKPRKIEIKKVN